MVPFGHGAKTGAAAEALGAETGGATRAAVAEGAVGAPEPLPRKNTAPAMPTTATTPSPTNTAILPAPGWPPVVVAAARGCVAMPAVSAGCSEDGAATVGALP